MQASQSEEPCLHDPSNIGLRAFLKDATADKHNAIDTSFARFDFASQGGFVRFLAAHLLVWRELARPWQRVLARRLDIEAPDYRGMLEQDLRLSTGSREVDLPPLAPRSIACDVGLAYVLAGSRLGMSAIARLPSWGKAHGLGLGYMSDRRGVEIFRSLVILLDGPEGGALDRDLVLNSANACFDMFDEAVERMEGVEL